ncbi:MAG: 4-hydroxy-tetrahydrodipicolinate reductase [Deltaproteobacteria bacterium]|nr:4-hydroxy-tetrahydrodipicolinate reductase [Deltaproteobacteria bacterium]
MIKLIVTGALGKMGRTILSLSQKMEGFEIVGAVEKREHPAVGRTLKDLGIVEKELAVVDDLMSVVDACDVVIDFTEPSSALQHFRIAKDKNKAIVIGTTGFKDKEAEEILRAKNVRVVISPNMSVGVNVMFNIVRTVSKLLGKDYDVEILEVHHRMKKDAPSGTALRLRDIIVSTNLEINWQSVYGRSGIVGERKNEELGVFSIRGGDVVGEHTVMFLGIGERLEITHKATSRENFAKGALLAAKWIMGKPEGIYSMEDVLGLRS